MDIGTKYAFNSDSHNIPSGEVFILLGDNTPNTGFFTKDNQALFDTLGEPYSKEAIEAYIETNGVDTLRNATDSIACHLIDGNNNPLWVSVDDVNEHIKVLEQELANQKEKSDKLTAITFYETDCPNGETFNHFIDTFKRQCEDAGLSVWEFTYHGSDNSNKLSVCHNGYGYCEDYLQDDNVTHFEIFDKIKKDPKYARLRAEFMRSTTLPKVRGYQ